MNYEMCGVFYGNIPNVIMRTRLTRITEEDDAGGHSLWGHTAYYCPCSRHVAPLLATVSGSCCTGYSAVPLRSPTTFAWIRAPRRWNPVLTRVAVLLRVLVTTGTIVRNEGIVKWFELLTPINTYSTTITASTTTFNCNMTIPNTRVTNNINNINKTSRNLIFFKVSVFWRRSTVLCSVAYFPFNL